MLSIAHTLTSLPLGVYLHNPFIIFAAAFTLHLLLDTLLHWNIFPDQFTKFPYHLVALDIIGGLVLAWLILNDTFFTVPVLVAIAGSNAPDVIQQLWELSSPKQRRPLAFAKPFFKFHDHLQVETRDIATGLISQIAVSSVAVALVFLV